MSNKEEIKKLKSELSELRVKASGRTFTANTVDADLFKDIEGLKVRIAWLEQQDAA